MYTVVISLLHACEAELRYFADKSGVIIAGMDGEPNVFAIFSDDHDGVRAAVNSVLEVNGIPVQLSGLPTDSPVMLTI